MKIGVNMSFIKASYNFGIGSYIINILSGLQELNLLDSYYLMIRRSFYPYAKELFPQGNFLFLEEKDWMKKTGRFENFLTGHDLDMIQTARLAKKENLDLVFYPFNAVSNNMSLSVPVVMTVHDLFHCNYPDLVSKKYLPYVRWRYQALIHHADHIITISDFVRDDISKYFPGVNQDKIHRIYNSIVMKMDQLEPVDQEKPFILCVNTLSLHKNHMTLLKAFHSLIDQIPHDLIFVGGHGNALTQIQSYINQNHLQGRVKWLREISDGQRNWLYKKADLFVSPSLHEGFGMTPVEAMMAKTPVITTKETSLYEATQGLAHYYEPATSFHRLAEKILVVLGLNESQDSLAKKANHLKKAYDPLLIAKEYDRHLKGICHENRH